MQVWLTSWSSLAMKQHKARAVAHYKQTKYYINNKTYTMTLYKQKTQCYFTANIAQILNRPEIMLRLTLAYKPQTGKNPVFASRFCALASKIRPVTSQWTSERWVNLKLCHRLNLMKCVFEESGWLSLIYVHWFKIQIIKDVSLNGPLLGVGPCHGRYAWMSWWLQSFASRSPVFLAGLMIPAGEGLDKNNTLVLHVGGYA